MSFDVVCNSCGAPSGPSVGICPFCKSILNNKTDSECNDLQKLKALHAKGEVDTALFAAQKFFKEKPDLRGNIEFIVLYVKILIETEGPSSLINSLLTEGLLIDPANQEINECVELIKAKQSLKKGLNDSGETSLRNIIRKNPNCAHAYFLLGTHLHWVDGVSEAATFYLEKCVTLQPGFLRAWGCLSVIYRKLGNINLAKHALTKCIELERNQKMRDFFQSELEKI